MSWIRKHPLLGFALPALGLVIAVEIGALVHFGRAAHIAGRELARDQRESDALAAMSPAPTAQNAGLIEAQLARTSDLLALIQREMLTADDTAERQGRAAAPSRRPDAFFDIAACVEALRNRAQQAGVLLRMDERFGFTAYANEAPASRHLADVFRQRQVLQYLVEALIDAKPRELVSVQRERPREEAAGTATSGPVTRSGAAADKDLFVIDPRISTRTPGTIGTRAFRLSFTGHTATLRTLLNRFAAYELPLVVRAVEVTPPERSTQKLAGSEAAPLVVPLWSRFTVTVELLDLTSAPGKAS